MSTTITVDKGRTTVAIRYYGGAARGGIVLVHADNREDAIARYGAEMIRCENRPVNICFADWLRAQEGSGYTLEFGPEADHPYGDLNGGISQSFYPLQRGFVPR